MTGLLTLLFTNIGSAGAGSLFKMLAGLIASRAQATADERRARAAENLQSRGVDLEFQKLVFSNDSEAAKSALVTRRIIALVGVCTFSAIALICTLWPTVELVTYTPADVRGTISLGWGLINFPATRDMVSTVTTGHLAICAQNTLSMIFGFYFTPGGKK